MSEEIIKRDHRDNLIYSKTSDGREWWYEWNEDGDVTYYKNPDGYEYWFFIYKDCSLAYLKNYTGIEFWWKIEKFGAKRIEITKREFEIIKEKGFLSRKEISRFELIEL